MIRAWRLASWCAIALVGLTIASAPWATGADKPAKKDAKTSKSGDQAAAVDEALAGVTTAADLEALAKKQTTAAGALALYKHFLKNPDIKKSEKDLARKQLPLWENMASSGKRPRRHEVDQCHRAGGVGARK